MMAAEEPRHAMRNCPCAFRAPCTRSRQTASCARAAQVEGRLGKFYAEVCLLEQPYVIDESLGSVGAVAAKAGASLEGFVRYGVGEASS